MTHHYPCLFMFWSVLLSILRCWFCVTSFELECDRIRTLSKTFNISGRLDFWSDRLIICRRNLFECYLRTPYEYSVAVFMFTRRSSCPTGPPENAHFPRKPKPNPNPRSADLRIRIFLQENADLIRIFLHFCPTTVSSLVVVLLLIIIIIIVLTLTLTLTF